MKHNEQIPLRPYNTGPWEAWRGYADDLEKGTAALQASNTELLDALEYALEHFGFDTRDEMKEAIRKASR